MALVPALALAALRVRWLTEARFSALWGLHLPLAASAGCGWRSRPISPSGHAGPRASDPLPALSIPPILFLVWRAWRRAGLPSKPTPPSPDGLDIPAFA